MHRDKYFIDKPKKYLTLVASYYILIVVSNRGGVYLANTSRADYFRERRKTIGQFNVNVSKERLHKLDEVLKKKDQTRTEWLNKKIDEEIGE